MPFQKLQFKPGVTRDITSLAGEGGWHACNNIRFRLGFPEKLGGWTRISASVYQGVCRSLAAWVTLLGIPQIGVGTNLKMYLAQGGVYNDITPIRKTVVIATNAFSTTGGTSIATVNDTAHGATTGDFVTLSGNVSSVGGVAAAAFNGEFQLTVTGPNTYTIVYGAVAVFSGTGGNTTAAYQLSIGALFSGRSYAWGAGTWGSGAWGQSGGQDTARVWSQVPFGQNLVFGPSLGALYQFTPDSTGYIFNRGVLVSSLGGAASVPLTQNIMAFSPAARILMLFGTNSYVGTTYDPMLVRWSASESIVDWVPSVTSQAGEYKLLVGSQIMAVAAARQDMLILTDAAAYTAQYVGAPFIFSFAQQSDNISVIGRNAATTAGGVVYWMGVDKFYQYDGRVQTLSCPLRNEVFDDINIAQGIQVTAGTNEGYSEVWWFYCSAASILPDKYVVFNYVDNIWYYGSMARTAWLDSSLESGPIAATVINNLVTHETGLDDNSTAGSLPISAFVQSSYFDLGDGHNYVFSRKLLPDVNFDGSTAATPVVDMTVIGRQNPGGTEKSTPAQGVSGIGAVPISQWTDSCSIRIRARQISLQVASNTLGVQWQLGTPRIEVRPDGRSA